MQFFNKLRKNRALPDKPAPSKELTRTEALACIPIRSTSVSWITTEQGEVLLEYPLSIKPFFLSLAKRFNKGETQRLTKKLQLDSTGSSVWHMLDEKRDVKSIVKEVAAETGLSLHEAELSVTTFLRELGRRGLILLK